MFFVLFCYLFQSQLSSWSSELDCYSFLLLFEKRLVPTPIFRRSWYRLWPVFPCVTAPLAASGWEVGGDLSRTSNPNNSDRWGTVFVTLHGLLTFFSAEWEKPISSQNWPQAIRLQFINLRLHLRRVMYNNYPVLFFLPHWVTLFACYIFLAVYF